MNHRPSSMQPTLPHRQYYQQSMEQLWHQQAPGSHGQQSLCSPTMISPTSNPNSLQPSVHPSTSLLMHSPHQQQQQQHMPQQIPSHPPQYEMVSSTSYDSLYYPMQQQHHQQQQQQRHVSRHPPAQQQPQQQQPQQPQQQQQQPQQQQQQPQQQLSGVSPHPGYIHRHASYPSSQQMPAQVPYQGQLDVYNMGAFSDTQALNTPTVLRQTSATPAELNNPYSVSNNNSNAVNRQQSMPGSLPSISILQQPLSAEVFKPPDTQINRLLGDYLNPDLVPFDFDNSLLGPDTEQNMYSKRLCLSSGISESNSTFQTSVPALQSHSQIQTQSDGSSQQLQQQQLFHSRPTQPSHLPPQQQTTQLTPQQKMVHHSSSGPVQSLLLSDIPSVPPSSSSEASTPLPAAPALTSMSENNTSSPEAGGDNDAPPRRRKRFLKTVDALQKAGLMEVTMKTAKVLQQTQMLQKGIDSLRRETDLFIESMLENPENQQQRDLIIKAFSKCSPSEDEPLSLQEATTSLT